MATSERGERDAQRGATIREGNGPIRRFHNYLLQHLQVLFSTLGRLSRRPFGTLMTCAVIGVALALPGGLFAMLSSLQGVAGGWQGSAQISLYLKAGTTQPQAVSLSREVGLRDDVIIVDFISRDKALDEFRALSGFGDALRALNDNPLPHLIVVQPASHILGADAVGELVSALGLLEGVEVAQLDMEWVERLFAMLNVVERVVWVMAVMLALVVLLVVGNTIRLDIENRRDEIVVVKLIGGTDRFIRRPFLYTGIIYGLFGGVIAVLFVEGALALVRGPVGRLLALYDSQLSIQAVHISTYIGLLGIGVALGLIGSVVALGRHMSEIEPE